MIALFEETVAERGGVDFEHFSFTPRPEAAVAVFRAGSGEKAALFLEVAAQPPHRIDPIAIDEAPAELLATAGAHEDPPLAHLHEAWRWGPH